MVDGDIYLFIWISYLDEIEVKIFINNIFLCIGIKRICVFQDQMVKFKSVQSIGKFISFKFSLCGKNLKCFEIKYGQKKWEN